jgi:hypothetical protein
MAPAKPEFLLAFDKTENYHYKAADPAFDRAGPESVKGT